MYWRYEGERVEGGEWRGRFPPKMEGASPFPADLGSGERCKLPQQSPAQAENSFDALILSIAERLWLKGIIKNY